MDPENASTKRYRFGQYEGYESRSQRRLQQDLGVDDVGAETIVQLRNQIIEMQSRIRQLEAELSVQQTSEQRRLARYREIYYEATWIEMEFEE